MSLMNKGSCIYQKKTQTNKNQNDVATIPLVYHVSTKLFINSRKLRTNWDGLEQQKGKEVISTFIIALRFLYQDRHYILENNS